MRPCALGRLIETSLKTNKLEEGDEVLQRGEPIQSEIKRRHSIIFDRQVQIITSIDITKRLHHGSGSQKTRVFILKPSTLLGSPKFISETLIML